MHITLEKDAVFQMLDRPMKQLKALSNTLKEQSGRVVEIATQPTRWWDLVGMLTGGNSRMQSIAAMGLASYHQVDALYENLAAMRSLAELAEGPISVTHKDLLHVAGARRLVESVAAGVERMSHAD